MASPSTALTTSGGTMKLSTESFQQGADLWCSSVGCTQPELVVSLLLGIVLGAAALVALFTVSNIREARDRADEERAQTQTERDAFVAFSRRVASMDAAQAREGTVQPGPGVAAATQYQMADGRLDRIQDHYRETVLAVDHHEEVYGESLTQHMAAEFGENVTATVVNGMQFTPQLKQALLQRSEEARKGRESLLRSLDAEVDALDDATQRLRSMDRRLDDLDERPLSEKSFERLQADYEALDELESECEEVVTARQDRIRRYESDYDRNDSFSLQEYLNDTLPVTYPVLADTTRFLDRIATAKGRVRTALTTRV